MANCWTKTSILPIVLDDNVELSHNTYLETIESEENEIYELVNNSYISTEEVLDDNQIIETILAKQLEYKQGDPDDSNEEPSKISPAEGLNGLKTFILFTEQMDNNFFSNNNNLAVFRKYIPSVKRKITESMKQKFIKDFFKSNQTMSFNNEYSLSDDNNNSSDNNFPDDDFSDNDFPDNDFPNNDFPDNDFPNDDFSNYDFSDNDFSDNDFSDDDFPDNNFLNNISSNDDDFSNDDL
ncbi:7740_t:CDS:2 [Dentiscutata erythropus]|uniref:7740_t:CDS:1 n=1 Tax=Dentiscutata erythropus TaxID=1348616 RepID=A0A9N9NF39_9GLOM|nr:7740_t:CDS:2 [Dentiscutata erythropus]